MPCSQLKYLNVKTFSNCYLILCLSFKLFLNREHLSIYLETWYKGVTGSTRWVFSKECESGFFKDLCSLTNKI